MATGRDESQPIRLFLVDDHEMVRRGLRDLVSDMSGIEVVGEADRASQALERIAETKPDVAILDVRLPDLDGIELCREIRSRHSDVRCLMFSSYSNDEALLNSIIAGASGYLLKKSSGDELMDAIRVVASGRSLIDPVTSQAVVDRVRSPARHGAKLSEQQQRVFELIVEGLTNRQIATRLELAEKTVKNYVSVLLDKLNVESRTQAAVLGAKLGLADQPGGEDGEEET